MTREEFKPIAAGLREVYTSQRFMENQRAFSMWYDLLKDIEYAEAAMAAKRYMMTHKYAPTPADIREQVAKIRRAGTPDEMNEMEAWSRVQAAISRSGYYAEEEYNKLPEILQRAVGSPDQLRTWAMMDTGGMNVVQSNFQRTFRAVQARGQEESMVSPEMQKLIEDTSRRLALK